MKFTSFAVVALLVASSQSVVLSNRDDNGKGVSYALDVPTLKKSELSKEAADAAFNQAVAAQATASKNQAAASASAAKTAAADSTATKAKADADVAHDLGAYKDADFTTKRGTFEDSLKSKEGTHNAKLQAFDKNVVAIHILNRKNRDLAAATASKQLADADLKANQERVAYEKD